MTLNKLLSRWNSDPTISSNIYAREIFPERKPEFVDFPSELHPKLISSLREMGIQALYTHQYDAWKNINVGKSTIIVTGTSSGKSLCYQIPVIDQLLKEPESRALFLFPTKALAQDQADTLSELTASIYQNHIGSQSQEKPKNKSQNFSTPSIPLAVYDGDTPGNARPRFRENASIVITNPDMLHIGILPHHTQWDLFFSNLKFIIIDELHQYRGVFGSHVANVIRRLKRVANFYNSNLQFIMTSATISNPTQFAEKLIEKDISLIDQDGSSRGKQTFFLYNPPLVNRELGIRRSSVHEGVRLADDLFTYNIQSLIFGRSRRTVELALSYLRDKVSSHSPISKREIRGYRSGYLPQDRRDIEQGIRNGSIRTVVATNALELGIDIGGMGATVLIGYPGTIAATLQQAGRAGRGTAESIAVLIATADPIDQYLAFHPEFLFERSPEKALINPDNILILLSHIRCAAFELPFNSGDNFGNISSDSIQEYLEFLSNEGEIHQSGDRFFWMADKYPAQSISLRSTAINQIILRVSNPDNQFSLDTQYTIGVLDRSSAIRMAHKGAIYLHEGVSYLVEDLDLENNLAWMKQMESDYFTVPHTTTEVQLIEQHGSTKVPGSIKYLGEINVISQVTGYKKVKWFTHQQIDWGSLDLPATELQTDAYWLAIQDDIVDKLRKNNSWQSDAIDYGPDWKSQRELALTRDNHKCQACGVPEHSRRHDVHHKMPARYYSSHKEANQLDNLITLCRNCHQKAESSVRVRSGLAGVAYVFKQLAPLFLMCDSGDIGVHSDPQSALSEGSPTIIIYDQIPAGIGFSQQLFEIHDELVEQSFRLVTDCECADGCPSCIGPVSEINIGGKREALALLQELLPSG